MDTRLYDYVALHESINPLLPKEALEARLFDNNYLRFQNYALRHGHNHWGLRGADPKNLNGLPTFYVALW